MGLPEFIEYQQEFRQTATVVTLTAEWRSKLIGQKQKWTRKLKAAAEHLEIVQPLQEGLDNARNAFQRRYGQARVQGTLRTVQDCENWKLQVEALDRMYAARNLAWQQYAQLLQEFHDEEASHAGSDQASLNNTLAARTTVLQLIRDNKQSKLDLVDYLEQPPMARDPQHRVRMPEHWLPLDRQRLRTQFARDVAAKKASDYPGLQDTNENETWRAAPEFGGGQSKCLLWLKFDDEELVEDRVLRKMVLLNERDWIDPTRWKGDVRSMADKEPLEFAITQAMDETDLVYTVGLREEPDKNRHIDNRALRYTLYLDWMNKGDLGRLIQAYQTRGQRIPEPFVWYVAEILATCGRAMLRGDVPDPDDADDEEEPENWLEVVHRDLKPSNVFLEGPENWQGPPIYPHYDRPVLGDYGLAVQTHDNDDFNPHWYNNRTGTPGFPAPEQSKRLNVESKQLIDEERLGEKTNVWGLGIVLWSMITNTTDSPEPAWLSDPAQDITLDIPATEIGHWSAPLRGIIRDCLLYNPALRPTFDDILTRIGVATDETGANLARSMRSGNATPAQRNLYTPQFLQDRYAYYMSADEVGVEI